MSPVENFRMIMFYTYVLMSNQTDQFYAGWTNNLLRRIKEHNQGLNESTKFGKPWKLIYYEVCLERSDAMRRERYFKTTQGKRLLRRRLKDYLYQDKRRIVLKSSTG